MNKVCELVGCTAPRAEVVARLKKIVEARHRNEDTSIVNYRKSADVGGRGGLIAAPITS
ncbi:hypothetical protein Q8F57_023290 [Paraburkholderia terrae]|nr:hypothetical protein [Paraburkholderia terrae]